MRNAIGLWMGLFLVGCGTAEAPPEVAPTEPVAAPEAPAAAPAEAPPAAARVWFIEPQDGAKVKSPLNVVFGVEGYEVQAAGEVAPGTGHHHLIVDGQAVPMGTVVPKDEKHIHYGQGQTETTVELAPGEHTLTMQFADGAHGSLGPSASATIRVTVE
jgi:hypothetical protein